MPPFLGLSCILLCLVHYQVYCYASFPGPPGESSFLISRSIKWTVTPRTHLYLGNCYPSFSGLLGELQCLHLYRVYCHVSFLGLSGELLFLVRISIRGSVIPRFQFYWVYFYALFPDFSGVQLCLVRASIRWTAMTCHLIKISTSVKHKSSIKPLPQDTWVVWSILQSLYYPRGKILKTKKYILPWIFKHGNIL